LKSIGIKSKETLRSNNALIPIIYYVFKNKIKEIDPTKEDYVILRKYLYTVLLNGVLEVNQMLYLLIRER
jgi:hypothetical protein